MIDGKPDPEGLRRLLADLPESGVAYFYRKGQTESGTPYLDNPAWLLKVSDGAAVYDAPSQGYNATHLGIDTVAELLATLDFNRVLHE